MSLIDNLNMLRSDESSMHMSYTTFGSNRELCNVCWSFGEWLEAYAEHRITPGVAMDGKAVANRYGLPLFQITGPHNCGRVRVFCMGFLQSEKCESVEWMLREFK